MTSAFYPPLISPTEAQDRRQNGSESTNATCLVCGTEFAKYRRWHAFCSPKCRKQAWLISHRTGVYTDVRMEIKDIKASLARIETNMMTKFRHDGD